MPAHLTAGQLAILRDLHAYPASVASDIAARLDVTTWSVCEALGSMRVDGLLHMHPPYRLTDKGRAAIWAGVQMGLGEAP